MMAVQVTERAQGLSARAGGAPSGQSWRAQHQVRQKQRAVVLVALCSLALLVVLSQPRQTAAQPLEAAHTARYCGRRLVSILKMMCQGIYASSRGKRALPAPTLINRPHIRADDEGIASLCCVNACSLKTLMLFCGK